MIANQITKEQLEAVEAIVGAAAAFWRAFGKGFSEGLLAEVYVAQNLGLRLCEGNVQGFDAVSATGERFQIKHRSTGTLNLDINNFDFDQIVLVNLKDDLSVAGMWIASRQDVEQAFVLREKFRKLQVTQSRFKSIAKRLV